MDMCAIAGMAILMAASVTGSPEMGQNRLIRVRARVIPEHSSHPTYPGSTRTRGLRQLEKGQ